MRARFLLATALATAIWQAALAQAPGMAIAPPPPGLSWSGGAVATDCVEIVGMAGGIPILGDAGAACGTGGGGSTIVSGTAGEITVTGSAGGPYTIGLPGTITSPENFTGGLTIGGAAPLTANQTISLSGGASGSGTTAIVVTLAAPSASSLGGVESETCPGSEFVNEISTAGAVTCGTPSGGSAGSFLLAGNEVAGQSGGTTKYCALSGQNGVSGGSACGATESAVAQTIGVGRTFGALSGLSATGFYCQAQLAKDQAALGTAQQKLAADQATLAAQQAEVAPLVAAARTLKAASA